MNPSLECELARVQMKRYLGGEELPPKLMEELEQHVRACSSCSHYLDSQKLKLAAKLSGAKQEKVKAVPAPKGPKDSEVFTKPKQAWLTPKTLGLAAALALVLFAMSAVAKDPTLLFGPKAASVRPGANLDVPANEEEPSSGSEGHEGEKHEESADDQKPIGKIMTGETVQKEIEESLKPQANNESHGDEEEHESKVEPKPEEGHGPDSPKKAAEPAKPEPEPKMDLIVAEEGGSRKKPAPAPHPKALPASSPKKSSARRIPQVKAPAKRQASKPITASRPASRPSTSGSIRIYDANGAPINP